MLSPAVGSILSSRSAADPPRPGRARQESFCSVRPPSFACKVFRAMGGSGSASWACPNTPVAPSSLRSRHGLIGLGSTSNSCAGAIMVFWPTIAETAPHPAEKRSLGSFRDPPHALNAGLSWLRGRLAMLFSSLAATSRHCPERPLVLVFRSPKSVLCCGATGKLRLPLWNIQGRRCSWAMCSAIRTALHESCPRNRWSAKAEGWSKTPQNVFESNDTSKPTIQGILAARRGVEPLLPG